MSEADVPVDHARAEAAVRELLLAVGEDPDNLEEMYEPFLLNSGLIQKTPRGRMATRRAFRHLGLPCPSYLEDVS